MCALFRLLPLRISIMRRYGYPAMCSKPELESPIWGIICCGIVGPFLAHFVQRLDARALDMAGEDSYLNAGNLILKIIGLSP